jgi:6,7-dimethyl-8-ribityllumazine synthase
MADALHVLIVEARFYDDIQDALGAGAEAALREAGAEFERVTVPGALEVPGAIALAERGKRGAGAAYDGYVALGCVIRGETGHYDIVAGESARGLMDLSLQGVAIGNGILTVENAEQAMRRADPADLNKGGEAAEACLRLIALRRTFGA